MAVFNAVNGAPVSVPMKSALKVNPSSPSSTMKSEQATEANIIDIRHDAVELNLKEEILRSLKPEQGPRRLPTLLLYDEQGLQLFEQITYLDEYYLTNAEIEVLKEHSQKIAASITSGSMVVELGSGNLRKVSILLQALDDLGKDIDYYALDLSLKELRRTLEQVPLFKHVRCHGLHGTYDDGLDWLKTPENIARSKCIMSLGSSIGNFHRHDAASFLKGFSDVLQPGDSMLMGVDATNDSAKVYHAYNDREGVTHKFILNGLTHANEIQGDNVFKLEDWKVIGEYAYDSQGGRHQAFYSPIRDVQFKDITIKAGERIQIEQSLKYSLEEVSSLWQSSGLMEINRWSASSEDYSIHMLRKSKMTFDTNPKIYAHSIVPTMADWNGLWAEWDTVTKRMIPETELHEKPIKLRNACIFYLGHIPTFMDIQLSKATKEPLTEPSSYPKIFERGIDPDVDNPEHCHAHSEVPDEWPALQEILDYQEKVRDRVRKLTQTKDIPRHHARALWIGFEHEIMHLETLLYMLLQSDRTLPPTQVVPDFEGAAKRAETARVPNQWFKIPEQRVTIGLDDPDDNSGPDHHFGWDNEKPRRSALVPSFEAQARPITNEEFALYLQQIHSSKIPASWSETKVDNSNGRSSPYSNGHTNGHSNNVATTNGHSVGGSNGHVNGNTNGYTNGSSSGYQNGNTKLTKAFLEGKSVRTVYGLAPLQHALHWPVFASYDELAGCANWMGGRIPTFEEAKSIYSHADGLKIKEAEQHLGKTVPAVNGHLSNDGVEETPPSRHLYNGESSQELFANLAGANVGFVNWHPVAVTGNGDKLAGQAEMGGVWEWTSSALAKHEGFEPGPLYPAYTADFFDGKHNIVLGGSWATHPRIAGRKTFVNWYQRNYPYVWAGARLVRDL